MSELPKTKPIVKNSRLHLIVAFIACVVAISSFTAEGATNAVPSEAVYLMHESFPRPDNRQMWPRDSYLTNPPVHEYVHSEHPTTQFNPVNKPLSIAPHASGIAHASGGHFWDTERRWWNGSSGLGNWFGLGFPLKDHGITISGEFKQIYFGFVSGGLPNQPSSFWHNEIKLRGIFDFGKMFGAEGWSFVSNWRYRNRGDNPQFKMGIPVSQMAESVTSGIGVRIQQQFLQWQSGGADPTWVINGGWVNPYEFFFQQPLSKPFELNGVNTAKGIGATLGTGIPVKNSSGTAYNYYRSSGVPWTSSYATWGGTLRVKPTLTTYIQSGLYLAISGGSGVNQSIYGPTDVYPYTSVSRQYLGTYRSTGQVLKRVNQNGVPNGTRTQGFVPVGTNTRGLTFGGSPTFKPNTQNIGVPGADIGMGGLYESNGLYTVHEIGWTPKFGKDKLDGKYVMGGYIWGQPNTSYLPVEFNSYSRTVNGANRTTPMSTVINQFQWGFYWQADQRLYAVKEESRESDGTFVTKVTKRGLYMINAAAATTPHNCIMPYYFHTGFVHRGLISGRPEDMMGIVGSYGFYSQDFNKWLKTQDESLVNDYTNPVNATVPNGPTNVNPITGGTRSRSTGQPNFYGAYRPALTYTGQYEAFYSVQVNKWATIKPYAQYIVNPAGNGTVGNEWIMGFRTQLIF